MIRSLRLLAPLAAAATLAACASEQLPESAETAWQGAPPVFKVSTTEQTRTLYVTPGSGALSGAERQTLDGLIADAAQGAERGIVHLTLRSPAGPATLDGLRRAAIAAGVEPTKIEVAPLEGRPVAGGAGIPVLVTASVSRAIPPSCPRTSVPNIVGYENADASNWGCSVVSNIEAQIADPRDLVQGESGGQTSGILTSAAIERLNTDKVKPLPRPQTSQVQTGGAQ